MKVIGITGGAGSGKTEVLKILETEFNAHIIIADDVSRHLCDPGEKSYVKIVDAFGTDILSETGDIDRKKLAAIIFADDQKREILNSITHPDVWDAIVSDIENTKKNKKSAMIIIEAALLIEAGYEKICDELWYVHTNEDIRRTRMKETRGYTDEKIDQIIKSQLSEKTFYEHCQFVIENNTTIDDIRIQLKSYIQK